MLARADALGEQFTLLKLECPPPRLSAAQITCSIHCSLNRRLSPRIRSSAWRKSRAKRKLISRGVNHLFDGLSKRKTDMRQLQRMNMRPEQRLASEVEAQRTLAAGHRVGLALEEVLIVIIRCAAVGEVRPGCPCRPARPLR